MTTYRTGRHWGVTIVATADAPWPAGMEHPDDQLVAVVVNGDQALAERICALLNEGPLVDDAVWLLTYALHLRMHGERAPGGNETWATFDRRCEEFLRRHGGMLAPATGLTSTVAAQTGAAGGSGGAEGVTALSERFDVWSEETADGGRLWMSHHRNGCVWSPDIEQPADLAELNRRASEHAEVCR